MSGANTAHTMSARMKITEILVPIDILDQRLSTSLPLALSTFFAERVLLNNMVITHS